MVAAAAAAVAASARPTAGSGRRVRVPLEEESATAQALLSRGWAVSPGERYRFHTPPGLRITTTALEPADAERLAAAAGRDRPRRAGDLRGLDLDLRTEGDDLVIG